MPLLRLTMERVVFAWGVFLFGAALILPNLSLQTRTHPAVKGIIATYWVLLLVGTPISLTSYLSRAWRRSRTAPNRGTYIVWLGLETMAAVGFVMFLFYATVAMLISLR
jgi:hypothetical protein